VSFFPYLDVTRLGYPLNSRRSKIFLSEVSYWEVHSGYELVPVGDPTLRSTVRGIIGVDPTGAWVPLCSGLCHQGCIEVMGAGFAILSPLSSVPDNIMVILTSIRASWGQPVGKSEYLKQTRALNNTLHAVIEQVSVDQFLVSWSLKKEVVPLWLLEVLPGLQSDLRSQFLINYCENRQDLSLLFKDWDNYVRAYEDDRASYQSYKLSQPVSPWRVKKKE
jgi:hypothetical protein